MLLIDLKTEISFFFVTFLQGVPESESTSASIEISCMRVLHGTFRAEVA